jgi:DNA-binding winged helix-turn-helix (wHTH) protein
MTIQDLDSSGQLRFDRYVLDLDRGCLLFEGNDIALRPKTFAVLQYLIEHAGRLVSKDELFEAVWPGIAVSDDALVQSIGELRRAFSDDGPRLIKTIPRRGYRLETTMSVEAAGGPAPVDAIPGSAAAADKEIATPKPTARNIILFSLSVAVLIAAGVLWNRAGDRSNGLNIFGHTNQSVIKGSEFGTKPTIAILPLVGQGDDSMHEYFADGLTQDIISALGQFTELTVMSWNAVSPFKGKPASPGEIAHSSRFAISSKAACVTPVTACE